MYGSMYKFMHVTFNFLTTHPKSFIRSRLMALCFHIFGSVHAMKTEIPPFDSEIKDSINSSL
jgi:hypothetical protein